MSRRAVMFTGLLLTLGALFALDLSGQESAFLTPEREARIDSIFADLNRTQSPGCALGVEEGGELVLGLGYGMADLDQGIAIGPSTVFRIGSTSKQFAAAAMVLLEMDGVLSLDDDVRLHLPELPDFGETVTLRHILNHTSGLRDWVTLMTLTGRRGQDFYSRDDVLQMMSRQEELNFPVGSRYLYSNSGFLLLDNIVERKTGMRLRAFTLERLFGPLGMSSTRFHEDHTEIVERRATGYSPRQNGGFAIAMSPIDVVGAGGLLTTVEDFARWSRNLADPQVGGAEFVQRLTRAGVLTNGEPIGYALGISHGEWRGVRTLGHGGSWAGYRADFQRFPDQDLSIMVFCNLSTSNPGARTRRVAEVLLEDVLEAAPESAAEAEPSAPSPPVRPSRATLERYSGAWTSPELGVTYQLEVRDGENGSALHLTSPAPLSGELVAESDATFRLRGYTLRFMSPTGAAAGSPGELRIDAGRVLNLRFIRPVAP